MNTNSHSRLPHYAALATLIGGFLLSVIMGLFVYRSESRENAIRFEAQVNQVQSRIRGRIESFENFLIQTRGFLRSKDKITRDLFHKYAVDIQLTERYTAIQGLAYISRIQSKDLATYVQKMQTEGFDDYKVWPEQAEKEYYPISYIEPTDWRNKRAHGFEMFSEPIRKAAMEKARDTGLPTLSSKVKLVQEAGEEVQPGLLMFLPIYQKGMATDTVENRRKALKGFLGSPIRAHDFFRIIFFDQNPLVDFEVFDSPEISSDSMIYDFDRTPHQQHQEVRKIELSGHTYTFAFHPLSGGKNILMLPIIVMLFGIIISILISWLIRSIALKAEEANEASRLKSAFLANMSHEIRTPLGAMIGFADLLRDPELTQSEKAGYADILIRNGENLAVIINDILDLSKVEAGHLTLEFTEIEPSKIAEEVVSLLQVKAKEKNLTFEYTSDESAPQKIVADPVRLRQILVNLIGNAIKFTQFGSVNIRSYGCKTENDRDAICFDISDTGIGIPSDQMDKVFQMFVQADGSMTRRFGGTGLGLALSKRLATEMGGDVTILKTQERVGSTFKVTVEDQPDKKIDQSQVEISTRKSEPLGDQILKGLHILVVDDSPDNQQLISRYLTKQGAQVQTADNGLLGYKTALTGYFDLILMDIQMPVMDGYTATQKLRENGYRKPIIALTAHAMSEVRKKAFNVGYTDHLTKPINPNDLLSAIVCHTK